jgi:hypothetical protein
MGIGERSNKGFRVGAMSSISEVDLAWIGRNYIML